MSNVCDEFSDKEGIAGGAHDAIFGEEKQLASSSSSHGTGEKLSTQGDENDDHIDWEEEQTDFTSPKTDPVHRSDILAGLEDGFEKWSKSKAESSKGEIQIDKEFLAAKNLFFGEDRNPYASPEPNLEEAQPEPTKTKCYQGKWIGNHTRQENSTLNSDGLDDDFRWRLDDDIIVPTESDSNQSRDAHHNKEGNRIHVVHEKTILNVTARVVESNPEIPQAVDFDETLPILSSSREQPPDGPTWADPGLSISEEMLEDTRRLLDLFGVSYIQAPQEAEAQCAVLNTMGLVDGVITDDGDAFLFGAQHVYRHVFRESRFVECYEAGAIREELGLDRYARKKSPSGEL